MVCPPSGTMPVLVGMGGAARPGRDLLRTPGGQSRGRKTQASRVATTRGNGVSRVRTMPAHQPLSVVLFNHLVITPCPLTHDRLGRPIVGPCLIWDRATDRHGYGV